LDRVGAENQDESDFIWKLIAWRLQNLDALVPTALIFVGPEGSFKTTIAEVIAALLAPYVLTISDPGKFVGRFNGHLFGKLFVQLEEVSLGKDETLDSRMKHFVNGNTLDLEEKGQPAFSIENRLFIAITSNKRNVIRISPSSRRYAAYWVKDTFNGDEERRSEHWTKLWRELESGGLEALMHDLLDTDLTGFNPRFCPRTPFFYELAGISSDRTPHVAWWQDILERGELPSAASKDGSWTDPVPTEVLYKSYTMYCDLNGAAAKAHALSSSAWAREMNKLIPGGLVKRRLPPSEGRSFVYFLPSHDECCAAFERAHRVTIERSPAARQVADPF
jgi:phage/plasmid-associated DNA primase